MDHEAANSGGQWTSMSFISAFLVLLSFYVIWREYSIWFLHLPHIPSAFWNTPSCYYQLATNGYAGRLYILNKERHDKHGRLIRIGPNHILSDDPDVIRQMSHVRSGYCKSNYFTTGRFIPGSDNTLSFGGRHNKEAHHHQRTLVASAYAGKENQSPTLEGIVDAQLAKLINLIETKYISSGPADEFRPLNFAALAQFFTIDVISALGWSEPLGFLDRDEDVGNYTQILENFLPIRAALGSLPILPAMLPVLERMLPKPGEPTGLGKLEGIAQRAVEARLKAYADGDHDDPKEMKRDVLAAFIEKGLRGDALLNEIFMYLVNGSDSTSTALRVMLAMLTTSPVAYAALNAEIASAATTGLSSPATYAECLALPYLQAAVREVLRLFPPPSELFKEVPPGGDTLCGKFIPAGTLVGHNAYAMGRRRDIYGQDADVFRPERWIDAAAAAAAAAAEGGGGGGDKERLTRMTRAQELVFGYGQFACLGKNVSLTEISKVTVELLRRFDFCVVDPREVFIVKGYPLFMIKNEWFRVTRKAQATVATK